MHEFFIWFDHAAERHGPWFMITVGLLLLAGWMMYWFGPRLDKILSAHLDQLNNNQIKMAKHSRQITRVHRKQIAVNDLNQKTHDLVTDIHTEVVRRP